MALESVLATWPFGTPFHLNCKSERELNRRNAMIEEEKKPLWEKHQRLGLGEWES